MAWFEGYIFEEFWGCPEGARSSIFKIVFAVPSDLLDLLENDPPLDYDLNPPNESGPG